ncbi:MAG TPA: endopeptidase La [Ruminococcaceae bacterium]|nr:endopeptidase La [Oscillospiraceae bacterium]
MPIISDNTATKNYPVLPLRGLVAFPKMILTVDVGRTKSLKAVNFCVDTDSPIYVVTQKNIAEDAPSVKSVYSVGCLCRIKQVFKMNNELKVVLEGVCRAKHNSLFDNGNHYVSNVERLEDLEITNRPIYIESLNRRLHNEFLYYADVANGLPTEIIATVASSDKIDFLSDFIAFSINAPFDDKQYVLEQLSPVKRTKIVIELLSKEREICKIDNSIARQTRQNIDENQKEYYLKEQMKVISDELYGDDGFDEIDNFFESVSKLNCSDEIKTKINSEIIKLSKMPQGSHEGTVVRGFIELCLELPWGKYTKSAVDINRAEKILDRDFYGMEKVKERILEMLSVYALAPDITGQIICLVGPPGVGKTSIGKTIAECMGRKFSRISLGGMHDEAEIRGHRKTYIGAMPGRIINAVKQAKTSNPLILLDEIDKLASDYKGDPASALLEVLDPEQNSNFCDNFLEIPYDLSKVVFITTANSADTIPEPLLDRMEVIELEGYTREEKFNIAKKHLVKKELASHALTPKMLKITDGALYGLIDFYTREAGVRKLGRAIASLCAKAAKIIASGQSDKVTVKESDLIPLLGKHKYKPEVILEDDETGIINGLAWTRVGGEIMQMEVAVLDGSGKVELTGNLGNIMKESATAAVTYVRANAAAYGIDPDFYKTKDIHIHATESAVPKDGPSAGVTITCGLVSALTGRKIRRDVAMTGEITIRGRVLPIGGLKEKSMAAYTGGVKTVFIPKDNLADLDEVDKTVRDNITFIPVSKVEDIISSALKEDGAVKTEAPTYNTQQRDVRVERLCR